ncbi:MAG: DMT family transporter, partial [Alphaproteobacteria bacterium]|nr:DMT family transporter [Alphaproteobacteria bacterium]
MIGLTLSWGLNGVAAKLSNTGYSPVFLTLARSVVGGGMVFLWCRWRGIRLFERDGTLWVGLLAGLLFTLEFLLIFVGLDYTSAARSTLLVNSMPFWV